ncbi:MAG: hypothetical protein GX591_03200 [Planctomycetes bacterium]|nr:hypothetical protein [Planctomycetota bacterium]
MNGHTEGTAVVGGYAARVKRSSWGAVFAGVAIALGVQLLLGTLGLAIGLTVINPGEEQDPLGGVGIGGAIWWVVTTAIALFVGGCVAGRLAGFPTRTSGALHGAVVWSVATLLGLYLIYSLVGTVIGGLWSVTATTVQAAGQAAGQAVQAVVPSDALDTIRQEAMQAAGQQGGQGGQEVQDALNQLFREGDVSEVSQADQQAVVDALVANTDMSQQEAQQKVQQWVNQYQQARQQIGQAAEQVPQKAAEVAGTAADVSAGVLWATFVMLLIGAIAAVVGGLLGAPTRDVEVRHA